MELFDVLAAGSGEDTEGFKCRGSFDAVDSDRGRVGGGDNLEFAWVVIDGCKRWDAVGPSPGYEVPETFDKLNFPPLENIIVVPLPVLWFACMS